MAGKLNDRQQRFAREYLIDYNATQAAIRAGYSVKTAQEQGSRLLSNVMVSAEIQRLGSESAQKLDISREWVLQRLAAIADADLTDFLTVTTEQTEKLGIHPITGEVVMLPAGWCQYVKVIDTAELPVGKSAALAGIKQGPTGIDVKTHDKVRALELLGKAVGLFDGSIAAPVKENNLLDAIIGSVEEDINADEIPELEQAATAGDDVVESPLIPKP